jgi:hypothetical protein
VARQRFAQDILEFPSVFRVGHIYVALKELTHG